MVGMVENPEGIGEMIVVGSTIEISAVGLIAIGTIIVLTAEVGIMVITTVVKDWASKMQRLNSEMVNIGMVKMEEDTINVRKIEIKPRIH